MKVSLIWIAFWIACFPAFAGSDAELLKEVKAVLKGKGDYTERVVERIGNKTIRVQAFCSLEADFTTMGKILSEVKQYPSWLLNRINMKPDGDTYYLKIMGFADVPDDPFGQIVTLKLDFPVIRKEIQRKIRFVPDVKDDRIVLEGEMPANPDSFIHSGQARMTFFPAEGEPGRVWSHVDGTAKLTSWLLYEAMPTRMLKREAGERIQIVIDNYQAEEMRRLKAAKPAELKKAASRR